MKRTLSPKEINGIIVNTVELMEKKKGKNVPPYIQMDLSMYSTDTIEAIKEAFVASGIHFDDRWNDGSDFIINVPVEHSPGIFRNGRRDAGTVDPRNPMHDSVHQPKKPSNLGRRDAGTVDPRNPMHDSVHQSKIPSNLGRRDAGTVDPRNPMHDSVHQPQRLSIDMQIQEAATQPRSSPVSNHQVWKDER